MFSTATDSPSRSLWWDLEEYKPGCFSDRLRKEKDNKIVATSGGDICPRVWAISHRWVCQIFGVDDSRGQL